MNTIRQELTTFLDGLVIGFLVAAILTVLFQYVDFLPSYSHLLALFVGGCVAGVIARGLWKGGVSAFFSGFFALFLFELIKDELTLTYEFTTFQVLAGLLFAVAGGIVGGFVVRPTIVVSPHGEPVKVYICPQCSSEIPMKTKFCPECGNPMKKPPEKKPEPEKGGGIV